MTNSPEIAKAIAEGFAKGLIAGLGSVAILLIIFWGFWVWKPNNVKLIFAQIWSVLSSIFGVFAERIYITYYIEGKVGKGIDNITKKIDGLEAEQIKITLVKSAVREAFIKDRVLLMRIQKKDDHGENLANIAHLYSQHLYSRIQPSLNRIQQEGIQLYTAKSILKAGGGEGLTYLDKKYYRPLIAKYSQLQSLIDQLEAIDNRGLFYSVFIQEMVFLGEKTMFTKNIRGVHEEITNFIKFLTVFANRNRGNETVDKNFNSLNIKVAFVLVAQKEKRLVEATQNYVYYVKTLPRNTESFYFMGWGENISFVRKVVNEVVEQIDYLEPKREKDYERFFEDGGRVNAICILARNTHIASLNQR